MPPKNEDLHGNAPDTSPVALILIDIINDLEFEGGEALLPRAITAARRIQALKQRAKAAGIPVIYANDNFGKWRSDFRSQVAHCLTAVRGRPVVELLKPDEDDYFVLKPKHSAFFATTLETLLSYLKPSTLILAGVSAQICVLFTAIDAYMRDFLLVVPEDCVASERADDTIQALQLMRAVLKADTTPSDQLDLPRLVREAAQRA